MFCPRYCYSYILSAKFNSQTGTTTETKSGYLLDSWKEQPSLLPLSFRVWLQARLWCQNFLDVIITTGALKQCTSCWKTIEEAGKTRLSNNVNRWKNFEVGPWNIKKVTSTLPFVHILQRTRWLGSHKYFTSYRKMIKTNELKRDWFSRTQI